MAVVGGLLVVAIVLPPVFTAMSLLRGRGTRFKDLSADEQARRHEAARLLEGGTDPT